MEMEFTLHLHCTSPAQAETVLNAFAPCEDISSGDIPAVGFRQDWELLFVDIDVFASFREIADDITAGMEDLVNADPDASFSGRFLAINCSSDGNLVVDYSYKDGELQVKIMETMEAIIDCCPECDEELETAVELEKHQHGMRYTCPACGAKFSFEEISFEEETITDFDDQ